ncbi:DctP family TRAP transporter solute-binding subunit [Alicyclobacillus ferrooxydans]|uniref:C4-dicarboxylate ABC transporter n=1 Tax=Alicyclobacillus ferrooxydans TaxID=471514 RepID=A0A0P9D6Y1_9BACL|nr:DctP family TRAP transporter solute-binding subunit [Alicyclobacillus ferrooxydans]KPV45113.1 hypothetical protein AN477_03765 [Alicyclobacillus ferrooxydans]
MKSILGIIAFVVFGLLTAVIVAFPNVLSPAALPYDYEQQGLDRQIIIKFAYVTTENTPKGLAAQKFAQLVSQNTHGRVKVELFPDGSLYNEFDEIDALERGNIQMCAPSFSIVSAQIPQWSIMDLPFAFANENAVSAAFNGDIGKQLLQTLSSRNMVGLALWKNGFRQLTNDKRPLVQPTDLAGLKFRTETSDVSEAEFRQLGATASALPFNQLYSALATHAADGEENSASNIYTQKLYQVQQYMTIANISYLGYAVLMNKQFWAQLPPDIRQEIQQAMNETTVWERQKALQVNQEQLQALENTQTHMEILTLTSSEKQTWLTALQPVYSEYASQFGSRLMNDLKQIQQEYGP